MKQEKFPSIEQKVQDLLGQNKCLLRVKLDFRSCPPLPDPTTLFLYWNPNVSLSETDVLVGSGRTSTSGPQTQSSVDSPVAQ